MASNITANGWTWSLEYQRYYRYVINAQGQSACEWYTQPTGNSQNADTQGGAIPSSGYDENMAPAAPANIRSTLEFIGTPQRGWYETLDSRYRVRTKAEAHNFFKQGRVFAMLWAETASANLVVRNGTENTAITVGRFGQGVYSQIRRFVVVKVHRQRHFVYACAISTYHDQGALKPGCNASEHTIVYLKNESPMYLSGEWERGMTKEPIQIDPTDPAETMRPTSRVRLGKLYSIEWNVKVRDIGKVSPGDMSKLIRYFKQESENGFDADEDDDATAPPQFRQAAYANPNLAVPAYQYQHT